MPNARLQLLDLLKQIQQEEVEIKIISAVDPNTLKAAKGYLEEYAADHDILKELDSRNRPI